MSQDGNPAPAPVLIVPFVWIGDFVRCHSVVRLLRAQAPARPVDMVSSTLCAPLADYMPGVRKAIIADLERRHPGIGERLLDDKGELRRFVNVYLNGDDIRFLSQLDSKVKDGDDISIVPAIAGGR